MQANVDVWPGVRACVWAASVHAYSASVRASVRSCTQACMYAMSISPVATTTSKKLPRKKIPIPHRHSVGTEVLHERSVDMRSVLTQSRVDTVIRHESSVDTGLHGLA